ncbi:MAG: hypothetical protein LBB66_06820 [Desulfovibrio sp.]|nr:hypothetical protein [Desulfovibrio sp.]
MKKFTVFLLLVCLMLPACASKLMQLEENVAQQSALAPEQAAIVFYRADSFGGVIQAPVAEICDNNICFVGIVSYGMKILHKTTPGHHQFFVGGESASLLDATLESGKYYYVEIDPRMGFGKARFAFVPATKEMLISKSFREDYASCKWYSNTDAGSIWFKDNFESMSEKKDTALKKRDSAEEKKKAILMPDSGTDSLLP